MIDWHLQYWDSSLFISFITGQEPARVEIIRGLLDIYDRGGISIVISTFVIAEVRRIARPGAVGLGPGHEGEIEVEHFDPEREERIRQVLRSDQLIIQTLTPTIGELAAEIGNRFPSLRPGDCVHIATALQFGVDVLFTYDGAGERRRARDLLTYDGRIANPPGRPEPLPIREPFLPAGPLFD